MPSLQAQAEAIAASYLPPATGRPSDIGDQHLLRELFEAIRAGNYLETACDLVGLAPVTVYSWKKRGEAGEEPFKSFANTLKRASAQAEAQAVANVRTAGKLPQFWAAEMTYLERRHPDRWARRQDDSSAPKVVVQIGVGVGEVKVNVLTPTFASEPQALSPLMHSLTDAHESYKRGLCEPSSTLSTAASDSVSDGQSWQSNPAGDPTSLGGGAVLSAGVLPKQRRVHRRGAGKKKGAA